MTTDTANTTCPLCGGSIGAADHACPNCHATSQQQDFVRAIDFAGRQLAAWQRTGLITPERLQRFELRFQG